MGLKDRMANSKSQAEARKNVEHNLAKNNREYRCKKLLEAWSRIPEVGAGLKDLPLQEAYNTAVNLDRQASYLATLNETQMSQGFNGFTPENMLRLVRLAMPNVCRNKIFTEFAMETARDSIKYVRPVFKAKGSDQNPTKANIGNNAYDKGAPELKNKFDNDVRALENPASDPNGTYNDINDPNYRKALYETTEDRYVQEFWTANAADAGAVSGDAVTVTLAGGPFGTDGEKFLDGYGVVFLKEEKYTIAVQDKRTKAWFASPLAEIKAALEATEIVADADALTALTVTSDGNKVTVTFTGLVAATTSAEVKVMGRYDSEDDFAGDYLGEVEIKMSDYEFKPRPTSIGVSWSQMTEIVLDTSFQVSAEEYLVTYASQEIRVALDYRAIKIAYQAARANPSAYKITFDAAYNTASAPGGNVPVGTKEGYIHNAQTFMSAIDRMGDTMLNDINRGGVSRLVAGPAAGSYMRLIGGYSTKGKMAPVGVHQFGELEGIPVFKVPSMIIPNDEILTIWKNDDNEADVAIAFGTLIPFYSTGVIQRKNFYKEAGLATYGDWQVLNYRYLGIIQVTGIKDGASN